MTTTRIERLDKIKAELGPDIENFDEVRAQLETDETFTPECILLVEECTLVGRGAEYHVTLHGQLGDAGDYNTQQEYASDWQIVFAVNLDTGQRYSATYGVSWEDA